METWRLATCGHGLHRSSIGEDLTESQSTTPVEQVPGYENWEISNRYRVYISTPITREGHMYYDTHSKSIVCDLYWPCWRQWQPLTIISVEYKTNWGPVSRKYATYLYESNYTRIGRKSSVNDWFLLSYCKRTIQGVCGHVAYMMPGGEVGSVYATISVKQCRHFLNTFYQLSHISTRDIFYLILNYNRHRAEKGPVNPYLQHAATISARSRKHTLSDAVLFSSRKR